MTQIISITQTPPRRFDSIPWVSAEIQEAALATGTWATIDTLPFETIDDDPANPAEQNFTTENGTGPDLWYRLIFVDEDDNQSDATTPFENTVGTVYTTIGELARILKIRDVSGDQGRALQRVIDSAAYEINKEIGQRSGLTALEQQLATEVNLERAVEHWQQQESAFGVIGIGTEFPTRLARDTWDRHANKLSPLKQTWGLA
jgi:hypothetical protein